MKKIPKILKTALLLFVTLLFLTSCEKDLYELPEQNKPEQLKISFKKFKEFENEPKLIEKIVKYNQKLEQDFHRKHGANYRTADIDIANVDFSNALYMEKQNGEHSYTFVINDETSSEVINLVLASKTNGDYKPYVVEYDLSDEDIINLQNGVSIDASNKTEISEFEILDNQLVADGGCYEIVEIWTEIPCAIDGCMNPLYTTFDVAYEMVYTCDSDNGGSIMDGGVPGSNAGNSPGGAGSNPFTHGGTGFNTSPLLLDNKKPCEKLKNLLDVSKGNITPAVNTLALTINSINSKEYGTAYLKDSDGNYTSAGMAPGAVGGQINVRIVNNLYAVIHSHPMSTYPVFSFQDVLVLGKINQGLEDHNAGLATFLLVSKNNANDIQPNVYAIVLKPAIMGTTSIESIINNPEFAGCSLEEISNGREDEIGEYYLTDSNSERAFLNYMKNYNVQLFKANATLTNWKELTLEGSGATATVKATDCN